MNIDQQLASLLGALDDVLNLERGLADATLPRAHISLVAGLDDALDLDAGLAQVVPPTTGRPPRVLDGFIAFAEEFSELPAPERLAARASLPVSLLVEAYVLAKHVPTVRSITDELDNAGIVIDVRPFAGKDVRRIVRDLELAGLESTEVYAIAREFWALPTRSLSALLRNHVADRLAAVLVEIDRSTRDLHRDLVDVPFADALLGPLSQLVSALTNVVGADLTSIDLTGLPLDGIRWSSGTRWPEDWETWVRENSVPVSADVFEIRSGKAGSPLTT